MTSAVEPNRIADLLRRYAGTLVKLSTVLEEEHQSLITRDLTALELSTEKKQQVLQEITQLERERDDLRVAPGMDMDAPGTETLLTRLSDQVTTMLEQCVHLNQVNGAIIEVSQQFNQRLLDIILGGSQDYLYDANGKNTSGYVRQSVARI